jgi:hypothetical protein
MYNPMPCGSLRCGGLNEHLRKNPLINIMRQGGTIPAQLHGMTQVPELPVAGIKRSRAITNP